MNKQEIKAVIFDLDGVIVSTDEFHYMGWKKIADEEGIYFDKTINNRLRGVSRMESLDIVLERAARFYSENEKLELAAKKNSYYVGFLSALSPSDILEGISDVLDALRKKGVKLAIGSSSRNSKIILEKIGLLNAFDAIADGTEIKRSKPDPEVFLLASKKLSIEPSECAVIEDALAGIDSANGAGMVSVAISDAKSYEKATYRIETAQEILSVLF